MHCCGSCKRTVPPGSRPDPVLGQFRTHLQQRRYNRMGIPGYVSAARQFLLHLKQQGTSIEEVRLSHLASFLQAKLERYRESAMAGGRCILANGKPDTPGRFDRLLRMRHSQIWPPPEPPLNDCERFQQGLRKLWSVAYGRPRPVP